MMDEYPSFLNFDRVWRHGPTFLVNLMFYHCPPSNERKVPVAARFVPFALYIHRTEVNAYYFWTEYKRDITKLLRDIESKYGNYYKGQDVIHHLFNVTRGSTVIVLGKDNGPELQQLIQVKDYLAGKGYEAHLIKEFPEVTMSKNEDKVRSWTGAARFCVMIDDVPSGHIAEYMIIKQQQSILGLIRPEGSGSTYMIGDDDSDVNFIRTFSFNNGPLDVIDEVITWAENTVRDKEHYNEKYPWRKNRKP